MHTVYPRQFLLTVFLLGLSFPVLAAPPVNTDPQARVGRISLLDGTVSFHTADQTSWTPATLNYPIVSGSSFWTEPSARTEVQVGSAALRLDSSTEVDVNELDDQAMRVEVTQGTVNLHVSNLTDGVSYQVLTPNEAVNILQPGTYRISAGINGAPDLVAVLKGQAQINDETSSVTIVTGETATNPPGDMTAITVAETVPIEFDNWSLARDNYEEPRKVVHYVSPEMTGYEDLDTYGTWQQMPNYGSVWIPANMPSGWAPYRQGHWAWVSPWGWTWIDAAPWGFAPYHYGRWAHVNNIWFWAPGIIAPRPVYAPALVAFVGGNGWSVSLGIGSRPVGWFPLAPNEVFHPPYRVSDRYIHSINATNVTNMHTISNNYYNGSAPNTSSAHFANRNFTTVVSAKDFASARPVNQVALKIPQAQLASAPITSSAIPVMPNHHFTSAPRAPIPPDVPHIAEQPGKPTAASANESLIGQITQHHSEQNAPTAAPGPAIQPHMSASPTQPQSHTTVAAGAPTVTPMPVEHGNSHMIPLHAQTSVQTQQPQRHEINVPHPEQKVPLMPSHEGWVRRAPQESAPHPEQHNQATHTAPPNHEEPSGEHNHP